jgi:hypothetical protein
MFAEILIVKNIDEGCSNYFLKNKFRGVDKVLRFGDGMAYLCFKDQATGSYYRSKCSSFSFSSPLFNHKRRAIVERCCGRSFKRLNSVIKINKHNAGILYTPTCYLELVSSHYLSYPDWQDMCPEAYDLVRTDDDNRVIVACNSEQEAHDIYQRINYDQWRVCGGRMVLVAGRFVNKYDLFSRRRYKKAMHEIEKREEYNQVVHDVISCLFE